MFCHNCGAEIKKGESFCSNCGNAVSGDSSGSAERVSPKFNLDNLFSGRIGRKHWWLGVISVIGFLVILGLLIDELLINISDSIFFVSVVIIYIAPLLSIHIRRLHDLNHPGWMVLLFAVPIANLILLLLLSLSAGSSVENKYGSRPAQGEKWFNVLTGRRN